MVRVAIVVPPTPPTPRLRHHVAAAGLIVAVVVLNLSYLCCNCPLDLAPDEAHYWHWSRHLDWSYYSKGPLVAWLIRGSCELFGPLSVRLVGTEVVAVRLPAVVCHAVLLTGWYVLAAGVLRSPRAGLSVVAVALTLPPVSAGAVLMTIDAPFLACWCWGLVCVWWAVERGGIGWWVGAGLCSAVGVLAKYPMLFFPVAVGAFLAMNGRPCLRSRGYLTLVGLTTLGGVPVVVWNAAHDWVSVRHVLGQAGIGGARAEAVRWLGPLGFAAGQAGFLLGFWFVALVAAARTYRPGRTRDTGLSLLWWVTVPVWLVFFVASFRTAGQLNWPAAAYVAGLVLAVAWVREHLHLRIVRYGTVAVILGGLVLSAVAHYPGVVRPLLADIVEPVTDTRPTPVRKLDPTCRLRGWRTLAHELDQIRDRLRSETGQDPVLAGMLWTTPGELAFYCRGHPEAYSFGPALADRHSQYDLWRPNPVADAQLFRGRTFLYVGDAIPGANAVFDRVAPPIRVVHAEHGVPIAVWTVWVCRGYRGFPPPVRSVRPRY